MVNKEQIRSVTINDPNYPELLRQIKKPPEELYYRGDFNLCHTPCLAVVGSRATPYGKWAAYNISKLAAEHGVTIVSGMASGIDSYAHMGRWTQKERLSLFWAWPRIFVIREQTGTLWTAL